MLYYLTATLYVLVCLVLMLVILLQQGKGGDIANAFGGGTSQAAFGARSGATVLSRATTIAAVLFILGALALGIIGQRGPGSVVGGRAPQSAPAPAR
jgi:preprotein translocase subunit SecG